MRQLWAYCPVCERWFGFVPESDVCDQALCPTCGTVTAQLSEEAPEGV